MSAWRGVKKPDNLKEALRSFCKRIAEMEKEHDREATRLASSERAEYHRGCATAYEVCRKYLEFLLGEY